MNGVLFVEFAKHTYDVMSGLGLCMTQTRGHAHIIYRDELEAGVAPLSLEQILASREALSELLCFATTEYLDQEHDSAIASSTADATD